MGRDAIRPGTVRYLKFPDYIRDLPGSGRARELSAGQAFKLTGMRDGNWVQVRPVDEKGNQNALTGWVDANLLKRPDPVPPGGGLVSFKREDYLVGPAGRRMLAGDFSHKGRSQCGYAAQDCMPGMPTSGTGSSKDFVTSLPRNGWRELQAGDEYQPDDIFVRTNGPNGHVGFIGLLGGKPYELSWMTIDGVPRIDARPLREGSRVFRRR